MKAVTTHIVLKDKHMSSELDTFIVVLETMDGRYFTENSKNGCIRELSSDRFYKYEANYLKK